MKKYRRALQPPALSDETKGITSADELVAPTPRRDPIDCALEDAKDYLARWDPERDALEVEAHDLITRLASLLDAARGLAEDYKIERDSARSTIEDMRMKRLSRPDGRGAR